MRIYLSRLESIQTSKGKLFLMSIIRSIFFYEKVSLKRSMVSSISKEIEDC